MKNTMVVDPRSRGGAADVAVAVAPAVAVSV